MDILLDAIKLNEAETDVDKRENNYEVKKETASATSA
jgi:hypothetical protein